MADAEILQAEVWDDSALLDSWNEAFEEYKKYHSLAAKGEKVRLNSEKLAATLENGEVPAFTTAEQEADVRNNIVPEDQTTAEATTVIPPAKASAATVMPQALLDTFQDDALKNIMMSWYYAGYYTGLYEGKQQGYASAMERQNT